MTETTPTTPQAAPERESLREEIARIIDPIAFSDLNPNGFASRQREAFAKADAILARTTDSGGVEGICERCGCNYHPWIAPSPLWNAIMREGSINGPWKGCELICPTCFIAEGEASGAATGWKVIARTVNVELETVTPSGRIWDDAQDLWVEPPPPRSPRKLLCRRGSGSRTSIILARPCRRVSFAIRRRALKSPPDA